MTEVQYEKSGSGCPIAVHSFTIFSDSLNQSGLTTTGQSALVLGGP